MEPNEFTWKQRGAIDQLLSVPFNQSPAPDLFERGQWEEGWIESAKQEIERNVRVGQAAGELVLARLPKRS